MSAIANQAKGAGFENRSNYGYQRFEFAGIENIHAMRESFGKFLEHFTGAWNGSGWLSSLDSTKWLDHSSEILSGAVLIKNYLQDGASVMVHCRFARLAARHSQVQRWVGPHAAAYRLCFVDARSTLSHDRGIRSSY